MGTATPGFTFKVFLVPILGEKAATGQFRAGQGEDVCVSGRDKRAGPQSRAGEPRSRGRFGRFLQACDSRTVALKRLLGSHPSALRSSEDNLPALHTGLRVGRYPLVPRV